MGNISTHYWIAPFKGNKARMASSGILGSDGQYTIFSNAIASNGTGRGCRWAGTECALASTPGAEVPPEVDKKFTDYDSTPVSIEVVENPESGHYDFDRSRY